VQQERKGGKAGKHCREKKVFVKNKYGKGWARDFSGKKKS